MSAAFKCAICGAAEVTRQIVVTRDDKYGRFAGTRAAGPAKYNECANCGIFIFEGGADFERAYSEGFYYSVDGDPMEFLRKRFNEVMRLPAEGSDNTARVNRIKKHLDQKRGFFSDERKPAVLDVGAGMGVFLARFADESWSATAVEPEPNACRFLREALPEMEILEGYSDSVTHSRKYDLITFNRVLEHIAAPLPVLQSEAARLSANGIMYIEVPDVLSYYQDGPNNEAFGFGHFMVYSPLSLELLAGDAGFEVESLERVIEPSGKFTLYAFMHRKEERPN